MNCKNMYMLNIIILTIPDNTQLFNIIIGHSPAGSPNITAFIGMIKNYYNVIKIHKKGLKAPYVNPDKKANGYHFYSCSKYKAKKGSPGSF